MREAPMRRILQYKLRISRPSTLASRAFPLTHSARSFTVAKRCATRNRNHPPYPTASMEARCGLSKISITDSFRACQISPAANSNMNRLALVSETTFMAPSQATDGYKTQLGTSPRHRFAHGFDVPYATFAPMHYE